MEAKDTEMQGDELIRAMYPDSKERSPLRDPTSEEKKLAEAQAIISFKAGIGEGRRQVLEEHTRLPLYNEHPDRKL